MRSPFIFNIFTALSLAIALSAAPLVNATEGTELKPQKSIIRSISMPSQQLSFEANQGQLNSRIKFLTRGQFGSFALTKDQMILTLPLVEDSSIKNNGKIQKATLKGGEMLSLQFLGANTQNIQGTNTSPTKVSYHIGSDSKKWQSNIESFRQVTYKNLYKGIDAIVLGQQGNLRYDLVVAPNADPKKILITIKGAEKLSVEKNGVLTMKMASGQVIQMSKPFIYQNIKGEKKIIKGGYALNKSQIRFELGRYDKTQALIIDPVISVQLTLEPTLATGSSQGIGMDSAGNIYTCGNSASTSFWGTPGIIESGTQMTDIFVNKFNSAGIKEWTVVLGGDSFDGALACTTDANGNTYGTGQSNSTNFPTTANAVQSQRANPYNSAFVFIINSSGQITYSSYLSAAGNDTSNFGHGVAADGNYVYVSGPTGYKLFETKTANGFQPNVTDDMYAEGFIIKVDPNVPGLDGVKYASYLGGINGNERPLGIAVDNNENAFVTGWTTSKFFPTTPGAAQEQSTSTMGQPIYPGAPINDNLDGFATKVNTKAIGANSLIYSTLLRGSGSDSVYFSPRVDAAGNLSVTGLSCVNNFPITADGINRVEVNRCHAFLTILNAQGTGFVFSSLISPTTTRNEGYAIATDEYGNQYAGGMVRGSGFSVTANAPQKVYDSPASLTTGNDGYVVMINPIYSSKALFSTYVGRGVVSHPNFGAIGSSTFRNEVIATIEADGAGNVVANAGTGGPTPTTPFLIKMKLWEPLANISLIKVESGEDSPVAIVNIPKGDLDPDSIVLGGADAQSCTENGSNLECKFKLNNIKNIPGTTQATLVACSNKAADGSALTQHVRPCVNNAPDTAGGVQLHMGRVNPRYVFTGFFDPVIQDSSVVNVVNAGRSIPIKFSLDGFRGLDVIESGYPRIHQVDCDTLVHTNVVTDSQTNLANNGLVYDATTDQYNYVWKTARSLAGTCQLFVMKLKDGTEHTAIFKLQ